MHKNPYVKTGAGAAFTGLPLDLKPYKELLETGIEELGDLKKIETFTITLKVNELDGIKFEDTLTIPDSIWTAFDLHMFPSIRITAKYKKKKKEEKEETITLEDLELNNFRLYSPNGIISSSLYFYNLELKVAVPEVKKELNNLITQTLAIENTPNQKKGKKEEMYAVVNIKYNNKEKEITHYFNDKNTYDLLSVYWYLKAYFPDEYYKYILQHE